MEKSILSRLLPKAKTSIESSSSSSMKLKSLLDAFQLQLLRSGDEVVQETPQILSICRLCSGNSNPHQQQGMGNEFRIAKSSSATTSPLSPHLLRKEFIANIAAKRGNMLSSQAYSMLWGDYAELQKIRQSWASSSHHSSCSSSSFCTKSAIERLSISDFVTLLKLQNSIDTCFKIWNLYPKRRDPCVLETLWGKLYENNEASAAIELWKFLNDEGAEDAKKKAENERAAQVRKAKSKGGELMSVRNEKAAILQPPVELIQLCLSSQQYLPSSSSSDSSGFKILPPGKISYLRYLLVHRQRPDVELNLATLYLLVRDYSATMTKRFEEWEEDRRKLIRAKMKNNEEKGKELEEEGVVDKHQQQNGNKWNFEKQQMMSSSSSRKASVVHPTQSRSLLSIIVQVAESLRMNLFETESSCGEGAAFLCPNPSSSSDSEIFKNEYEVCLAYYHLVLRELTRFGETKLMDIQDFHTACCCGRRNRPLSAKQQEATAHANGKNQRKLKRSEKDFIVYSFCRLVQSSPMALDSLCHQLQFMPEVLLLVIEALKQKEKEAEAGATVIGGVYYSHHHDHPSRIHQNCDYCFSVPLIMKLNQVAVCLTALSSTTPEVGKIWVLLQGYLCLHLCRQGCPTEALQCYQHHPAMLRQLSLEAREFVARSFLPRQNWEDALKLFALDPTGLFFIPTHLLASPVAALPAKALDWLHDNYRHVLKPTETKILLDIQRNGSWADALSLLASVSTHQASSTSSFEKKSTAMEEANDSSLSTALKALPLELREIGSRKVLTLAIRANVLPSCANILLRGLSRSMITPDFAGDILKTAIRQGCWSEGLLCHAELMLKSPTLCAFQNVREAVEILSVNMMKRADLAHVAGEMSLLVRKQRWSHALRVFESVQRKSKRQVDINQIPHVVNTVAFCFLMRGKWRDALSLYDNNSSVLHMPLQHQELLSGLMDANEHYLLSVQEGPGKSELDTATATSSRLWNSPQRVFIPKVSKKRQEVVERSMRSYSQNSMWAEAMGYYQDLRATDRATISRQTAYTMIEACQKAGQWSTAISTFYELSHSYKPTSEGYVAVLQACQASQQWEKALQISRQLLLNPQVNPDAVAVMLLTLSKQDQAKRVLRIACGLDFIRHSKVCDAVLTVFVSANMWHTAVEYFCKMMLAGVRPEQRSVSLALQACTMVKDECRQLTETVKYLSSTIEDVVRLRGAVLEHVLWVQKKSGTFELSVALSRKLE